MHFCFPLFCSTIDWCEPNYAHSHYVAEFFNCVRIPISIETRLRYMVKHVGVITMPWSVCFVTTCCFDMHVSVTHTHSHLSNLSLLAPIYHPISPNLITIHRAMMNNDSPLLLTHSHILILCLVFVSVDHIRRSSHRLLVLQVWSQPSVRLFKQAKGQHI